MPCCSLAALGELTSGQVLGTLRVMEPSWVCLGLLALGKGTNLWLVIGIASGFSPDASATECMCDAFPGTLALGGGAGPLPVVERASGSIYSAWMPPPFVAAPGPILGMWRPGTGPTGGAPSCCMVPDDLIAAWPPGLQCQGKLGGGLSQLVIW